MEGNTDADYKHAKIVWKNFEMKNIGSITACSFKVIQLLADVFENFRNKCIEIYKLDPAHFYQHLDQHGKNV